MSSVVEWLKAWWDRIVVKSLRLSPEEMEAERPLIERHRYKPYHMTNGERLWREKAEDMAALNGETEHE